MSSLFARRSALGLLLGAAALWLASCGSDGSGPSGPTDATAPSVAGLAPGHGELDVAPDAPVVVAFSEAMAAGSAAGNVILSSGAVADYDWLAPDSLRVTHTAWANGQAVTVQLLSGLRDAAGNALAPLGFTFYTQSDVPVLLASEPADGAEGADAAKDPLLLFSEPMDAATLAGAVSLEPPVAFTVVPAAGSWYRLDLSEPLALGTAYTLSVGTSARSQDGQALAAAASVGFTTAATGDTTPPRVLATAPGDGDANAGLSGAVTVWFSEAMDPASAAGQVALDGGALTGLAWPQPDRLEIRHEAFAQGRLVSVTLGAGLADAAGNPLGTARTVTFRTWSAAPLLLEHWPADGAVGVPVNADIRLRFSTAMNLDSLRAAVTVGFGLAGSVVVLTATGGNAYRVDPLADLPTASLCRVRLSTRAASATGVHLAEPAEFSFTTGAAADATPPSLLATTPARNEVVAADLAQAVLTFSEPVDRRRLSIARWSGLLPLLLEGEPAWNADGTALTLRWRAPLPAGVRVAVVLDSIPDLAGNWSTAPDSLAFTVAGAPDHAPLLAGATWLYDEFLADSGGRKRLPQDWLPRPVRHVDALPDGGFARVAYEDLALTTAAERLHLQLGPTGLVQRGYRRLGDGQVVDVAFTPPVPWLPAPLQARSWSGAATASTGETVNYAATLSGPETVPGPAPAPGAPRALWEGCWKLVLNRATRSGGTVTATVADTLWFAPGAGVVRHYARSQQPAAGTWTWTRRSLTGLLWE